MSTSTSESKSTRTVTQQEPEYYCANCAVDVKLVKHEAIICQRCGYRVVYKKRKPHIDRYLARWKKICLVDFCKEKKETNSPPCPNVIRLRRPTLKMRLLPDVTKTNVAPNQPCANHQVWAKPAIRFSTSVNSLSQRAFDARPVAVCAKNSWKTPTTVVWFARFYAKCSTWNSGVKWGCED